MSINYLDKTGLEHIGDIANYKKRNIDYTTYTGTDLDLEDTLENKIDFNNLYGQTEQDSYEGKNLFDKSAVTLGKIVSRTDGTLSNAANYNASDYIPMKENTTYTLTARNFNRWYSACYDENKNYIGFVENEATFTTISGTKYMRFSVYNDLMDTAMIVEGTELPDYEPYVGGTASPNPDYPQEIKTVTGRQVVKITGKNLLDASQGRLGTFNNLTISYSNGNILLNGTSTALVDFYVGTSAYNTDLMNYMNNNLGTYTLSNNLGFENYFRIGGSYPQNQGTITSSNKVDLIFIRIPTGTYDNEILNIQIEKNSTATDYEGYKEQSYELNLGKNLFDENYTGITSDLTYKSIYVGDGTFILSTTAPMNTTGGANLFFLSGNVSSGASTGVNGVYANRPIQKQSENGYVTIAYRNTLGVNPEDYDTQLEKGTQATSYSPYFTPIELNKIGDYQDSIKKSTGKNLFDKSTAIVGKNWNGDNLAYSIASDYIEVEEGKTYVISTTNMSSYSSTTVVKFDSNKNVVLPAIKTNPFTVPEGIKYIKLSIRSATSHTWTQSELDNAQYQLEQNSQATDYEPYGKVWYIEKNISRVVLNGSETYETAGTNTSGKYKIRYAGVVDLIKRPANANIIGDIISNQFISLSANYTYRRNQGISVETNGKISFYDETLTQSTSAFKTWLESNNMTIYYGLNTPTYTEITNEELINSLESVSNINLQNGINNIVITSANLPMLMELHYNFKEAYTEEDLLFCGCVKNTGNISLNPREPHYVNLQVLDFKVLLSEGETLNYVINGKTIIEAINQVVASISDYGFVVGNIQILNPDDIINAYSTLNKTAYDVFQYIADITQSRWTTRMIDENTIAIDFYDPTLMPTANPIESTQEYACQNKINNITFNYSTNDYRNKQIMTSDEVFGNITQTETIIADGYTKNFMCENKIGTITGITVNGVAKTFITKSEQELGASADFIYQPGDTTFNSSSTIGAGNSIVITYYPIVKGREIILNSGETTRIGTQIGRKGTLSRYENRNDTTSSAELQKIGQSYIKYKGQAEISLKVVSENNLFNVGQIVEYQAPLEELSTEYMVKSKQIDWYPNIDKSFYTFELTNNFNYENAVNYFDNQRAKSQGNIGEGETITRNIDLESTALIKLYDTEIEEVQIQNPTSLDFALDGVII